MKNYTYLEAGIMDSDNGSCLMEEITENTDIDEMVFDAIKVISMRWYLMPSRSM